ncbi:haspin like kinase domain-containing protein [Ditylenchus destructor]|nr:haspin like kinase domain-containing protein [Ditylenchus destructor]
MLSMVLFALYLPNFSDDASWKKLGDGGYGETYTATFADVQVIKVIPLAPDQGHVEGTTSPKQAVAEVVVGLALTNLRDGKQFCCESFAPFKVISVVEGEYPEKLLEAWQAYQDKDAPLPEPPIKGDKKPAANKKDKKKAPPKPKPKFLVIRQGHGGVELEKYDFKHAPKQALPRALSIFFQASFALAVAEAELLFEHRDMHISNVLVAECVGHRDRDFIKFTYGGQEFTLKSCWSKVSIIDYTWSRMKTKDGEEFFGDFSTDAGIFEGNDDHDQLAAYKAMGPVNRDWSTFTPRTNVVWLQYLAKKLFIKPQLERENEEAVKSREAHLAVHAKLAGALDRCERVKDVLADESREYGKLYATLLTMFHL